MSKFCGVALNMGTLSRLSDAETRSISPENLTGEKGKGAMSEDGPAANAARALGRGWKVSPYVLIEPGQTFELANISGQGAIQQIWMTLARGKLLSPESSSCEGSNGFDEDGRALYPKTGT